jgi:alpha-glucosidase
MMRLLLCLLLAISFSASASGATPPLYWTPYEYNYTHDDFIPEQVFKANVDWVASRLAPFGYDSVVTDGWIYGDTAINADGYITKYSNAWTHDFAYWSGYCASHGLKLGVYFNPLWILQSAYEQNGKVQGTSIPIQSIAGPPRSTQARYQKHWVDPSKPGAKEYVQGYVRYFKAMGVKLLRLDFLTEFEAAYGTAAYDLALSWIREAAGEELFISLVMPNAYDMASTEVKYGDMMRVSEDTFTGGWPALSGRNEGSLFPIWPRLRNAFDGFIYFSPVSGSSHGPGKLILDGDAIRLNTFASDEERKTCISLYTLAGSPIPIADQVDTIGPSAWLYENRELLELSKSGFVGKPLSPALGDPRSETWTGRDGDAQWIVGLFNRGGAPATREIDFASELRIQGAAQVRDLWRHQDLGSFSKYSVKLGPHESRVLRIYSGPISGRHHGPLSLAYSAQGS